MTPAVSNHRAGEHVNVMDNKKARNGLAAGFRQDPLHALQLLRDLTLINERTLRELGPLPPGGVPMQTKRRPDLPYPAASIAIQDDEMNPLQRIMAISTLVTSTLAACGEARPPEPSPAAAVPESAATASAPTAPSPAPAPTSIPSASEAASVTPPAPVADDANIEIERGPPIPSATLRKQVLALLESLQVVENLEYPHVESIFNVRMVKNPRVRDGYEYSGITTEGWTYRIEVIRLYGLSDPPTITVVLSNGIEPWTNQKPTYCTMDFEDFAKDIVFLGYERGATRSISGNKPSWGFGRHIAANRTGFSMNAYLYYLDEGNESEHACVRWFDIDGGPRHE